MNQEEHKMLAAVQMEIMDEVHRICEENGITYYMIGGTLLGAVRHGGYIPWDLDIDIAMPRDSYIRFKKVCESELDEAYCYYDYTVDKQYDLPHALVSKKNTKLSMKYDHLNPARKNKGIYLDIFPLDNAPDDPRLREKQAVLLQRIRCLKGRRLPYSYSYHAMKRYMHYAVAFMLSWIPVSSINRYQQKTMQKYNHQKTECICSMASRYAYIKQCMSRDIYGEPVLLPFEDKMYFAPARYEEYLSKLYGDYMELPPEKERNANFSVFTAVEVE